MILAVRPCGGPSGGLNFDDLDFEDGANGQGGGAVLFKANPPDRSVKEPRGHIGDDTWTDYKNRSRSRRCARP